MPWLGLVPTSASTTRFFYLCRSTAPPRVRRVPTGAFLSGNGEYPAGSKMTGEVTEERRDRVKRTLRVIVLALSIAAAGRARAADIVSSTHPIARIWRGHVNAADADAYQKLLDAAGVQKIRKIGQRRCPDVPPRRGDDHGVRRDLVLEDRRRHQNYRSDWERCIPGRGSEYLVPPAATVGITSVSTNRGARTIHRPGGTARPAAGATYVTVRLARQPTGPAPGSRLRAAQLKSSIVWITACCALVIAGSDATAAISPRTRRATSPLPRTSSWPSGSRSWRSARRRVPPSS